MSHQSINEVHIYVRTSKDKHEVRHLVGRPKYILEDLTGEYAGVYSVSWAPSAHITANAASMQNHLKPMVNLKELREIVLLISLGIPAEEAISTITKQGYES